jgi:acid phosphatase family membrane protein YuiD
MADPILDLSTLVDRPKIRIDGTLYELRSPDELSVLDSQRLTSAGKRIDALAGASDPAGEDDSGELAGLIDDVTRRVLVEIPETVFESLSQIQKLSICEVFTGLLLGRRMALAGAIARKLTDSPKDMPSTGAMPSRDSSASTVVIPKGGSSGIRRPS